MEKRDLLGLPDEEPVFVVDAPGVPSDDVSEGSEDEEEAFAPDPPAASDNCANPIEGGWERNTEYTFFYTTAPISSYLCFPPRGGEGARTKNVSPTTQFGLPDPLSMLLP